jgi:hypothetical protein
MPAVPKQAAEASPATLAPTISVLVSRVIFLVVGKAPARDRTPFIVLIP